jgi:DNA modification methylase
MEDRIIQGDALQTLKTLPDESVDCVITSPPYWALRDYGVAGQIGMEQTYFSYLEKLLSIFNQVKRVLKKYGTCWVNIGDTYYGGGRNRANHNPKVKSKTVRGLVDLGDTVPGPKGQAKCLAQIPSRFAIEMVNAGWILRNEIIWHKPNAMPSSATDRFTVDFEKVFFFTKNTKYWFESQNEIAKYDGRKDTKYKGGEKDMNCGAHERWKKDKDGNFVKNKRAVWSISTKPFAEAHFATFPEALIEPMIKAGCPPGGVVLDPFFGAGTTGVVAKKLDRNFIGIELNPEYIKIAEKRLKEIPNSLFHENNK